MKTIKTTYKKGVKKESRALTTPIISLSITVLLGFIPFFYRGEASGSDKEGPKKEYVIMATPGRLDTMTRMPLNMAEKMGFYKMEGLEVETISMKGPLITSALSAGGIDYSTSASANIQAAALGLPIRMIFNLATGRPTFLVTRPEIKKVTDLKGKSVGTGGSTEDLDVKEVAVHYGLDPDRDVTIIVIGPGMKIPALSAGSVDAVHATIDESLILRKRGFNALARFSDIVGETVGQGLGTQTKRIKENPSQVKRVLRASLKGIIYVREHRDDVINYMIKEWKSGREVATVSYDEHIRYLTKDGTATEKTLQKQLEIARKMGFQIKPGVGPAQVADFTLLKEVQKELGLKP